MAIEDALDARPKAQIDIADESCDAARRPVIARGTHRRNATDELGFAKRPELLRSFGAVHRAGLLGDEPVINPKMIHAMRHMQPPDKNSA